MFCQRFYLALTISIAHISGVAANCPRCAVIEEERAKEQGATPQKVEYYDDQLKSIGGTGTNSPSRTEKSQLKACQKISDPRNVFVAALGEVSKSENLGERSSNETGQKPKISLDGYQQSIYSAIYTILKTKDFLETLDESFTILIPTNAALLKLPAGTLENLSKEENAEELGRLVSNHVIAAKLLKQDFEKYGNKTVKAISGRNLTLSTKNGKLFLDDAQVMDIDPAAYQGVIILIDKVLQ
jgi:uncharacterized surface protein with fasciclin (FAS1) repeats